MAKFKIGRATAKGKSYTATGVNPVTGREMRISGGQAGRATGDSNPDQKKTFQARHGEPKTPKQWINKVRWENGGRLGESVNIPNRLFKKGS
jgi:hypothetical protein